MKLEERRRLKREVRYRIDALRNAIIEGPGRRVPERIVNGSWNVAVQWKQSLATIPAQHHVIHPPPSRASLNRLLRLEERLRLELQALQ